MRKRFVIRVAGACIATSVLAFGAAAATQPAATENHKGRLDGVTLFRGLFLGSGPVAGVIPNAAGVPGNMDPLLAELETPVLDRVQDAAPDFMDRFGIAIQSGNPVLVGKAVREGSSLFREALVDELQVRDPDLAATLLNELAPRGEDVGAVAAVGVAVVIVVVFWFWFMDSKAPAGELSWEVLVRDITTEFATS